LILLFFPILLKASWIGDHRSGTCVLAAMSMVLQGKPIALSALASQTFIRSLMQRSLRLPDAAPLAASPSEVRQPPLHIHPLAERFAELID
jgi:hypothetical protein